MDTIKQLNYVFNKKQKRRLLLLLVAILIGAALELVGVSAILPFINAMVEPQKVLDTPIFKAVYDYFGMTAISQFVILSAALLIFVYVVKNIYIIYMNKWQYQFTFNNRRKLANRMMKCYMKQPYIYHLSHGSAELIRNIDSDTNMFFSAVLSALQLVTEFCVCTALVAYLFYKDKSITLGVCGIMVIFMYLYIRFIRQRVKFLGLKTREYSIQMNKTILQAFGGIKEVKILERENFFLDSYNRYFKASADALISQNIYGLLPRNLMEAICISGLLLVVIVKLLNGTTSTYFVTTISVFALAAFRMLPSFSRLANCMNNIFFNKSAIESIYHDLQNIENLEKVSTEEQKKEIDLPFAKEIKIQQVDFRYPNMENYVLKNIDMVIPKNKSVAIIGPSGEGKTTLADIVLGLLTNEAGSITVDGKEIQDNISAWHKKLGYIPQSIFLTDDTIRNNIAFGVPPEEIDEDRMWKALEDAQIKEFVLSLELGVETEVGERGVRLSGGQRQRIGIARALYNRPEILVLDEATSALDNDTETAVMESIEHLAGNVTMIIIAHRLTTIKNCDLIYEVKGGSVQLTTL